MELRKKDVFFNFKNRYTGHRQKWVTLLYIFDMHYILDSSSNSGRYIRFYNLLNYLFKKSLTYKYQGFFYLQIMILFNYS